MKYVFFFIFVLFRTYGQQPSHYIIGEEELAGINIYSIIQDEDNAVWLGTNNGLYHYDGFNFTIKNAVNIKDLSLFGLIKDNKGTIFCYNLSGQIFKINKGNLEVFWEIPKHYLSNVIYINFDNSNNLIVSCKKLLKLNKNKKLQILYEFEDSFAAPIVKDNSGHLVFYHNQQLFHFFNEKLTNSNLTSIPKTGNTVEPKILPNNKMGLFFNLEARALVEKNSRYEEVRFNVKQDKTIIYSEFVSKTHDLVWFSNSKNGIYCFKSDGTPLFSNKLMFKDTFISSYLEDSEGNFWLGTFGKGIILIPNLKIIDYSNNELLKNDDLKKITKINETLYFGGSKGALYSLTKNDIKQSVPLTRKIEFLAYLPKADLFFINNLIYSGANFKLLKSDIFNKYDVLQDRKSEDIYFVTRSGLFTLNTSLDATSLGYNVRTYAVNRDKKNNTIWIASSTGLEIYKNGRYKKILVDNEEVFSTSIISIGNKMWVASSSGVFIFENGKLSNKLITSNGLLSNITSKLINHGKYVYISTNEGLQRYDLNNKTFSNFTKSEGLLSRAIFDFEIVNNDLFVITSKGLQKFNFDALENTAKLPKISISDVLINSFKTIKNNAHLLYNENNVEFTLKVITHKNKRNLKYLYQLEGFESKWAEADFANNKIKYIKLPAGAYKFKVRLKDGSNISENTAMFLFEIDSVFWKKWQFFVPVSFLLLALSIISYQYRIRFLFRRKNEEIEKQKYIQEINKSKLIALKSQMNPHFIFNALNSIQDFIMQNKKELASNYLGDFADLMRIYLNHSQEDTITLRNEINTLTLYLSLEQIRFEDQFMYSIEYDESLEIDALQIPSFLIQPFVENAIKHGLLNKNGSKIVSIKFNKITDETMQCIVEDNGIGREASELINAQKKHNSFATKASKSRLQLLNQDIGLAIGLNIEDMYDVQKIASGTRVILSIPLIKLK